MRSSRNTAPFQQQKTKHFFPNPNQTRLCRRAKVFHQRFHAQRKRCGSLCAIWSRKHRSTCLSIRTAGRRLSNLTPAAPFCSHLTTRCANWKRKDKAFCSSVPLCTDAPSLAFACSSDMAYAGRTCAEAASRAGAETAPMRNRSDTRTLRALPKAGRKQNAFGGFDNDSYCVPFPLRHCLCRRAFFPIFY